MTKHAVALRRAASDHAPDRIHHDGQLVEGGAMTDAMRDKARDLQP